MSFLGNAAIILAFLVAIYTIAAALMDSRKNKYGFPTNARFGVFAVAGLVTLAVAVLLISLLTHNFSLQYVADYSSRETPLLYLVTGLWAGNPGSLLFWGWIISLSGAILLWRSDKNNKELMPDALSIVMFTVSLFLVLIFIDSPFKALSPVPADGLGLKPVLQNVGMVFHPPLLLAGYALFTIPFALAMSALFNRKTDDVWVTTAKRWAVAAFLLLGLGNVLGMWWAYAELGWGGYWAWDPVENAGLMPWLLVTAFLHSGIMYVRRGMFKTWTFILAITAFWLTIFGAFLTRSDVKGSVHTFGQTPMTPVFIVFLVITLVGSVWLLLDRRKFIKSATGDDSLVSGTGTFVAVSLLLAISTVFIFIGTTLPVFTNIIPAKGYFNMVNLPLFLLIIALAGVCVLVGWKVPDLKQLGKKILLPLAVGILVVVALIIGGVNRWYAVVPFFILAAVLVATFVKWSADVAARMRGKKENFAVAFGRLFMASRSRYGGYIIHIAIVVLALGIVGSSAYKTQVEKTLNVGDTITLNGYTLKYNGFDSSSAPQNDGSVWLTVVANMDITYNGKAIGSIHPSQVLGFTYSGQTITNMSLVSNKVAIRSNLARDFYVIFEDFDGTTNQGLVMVIVNPLVEWIWIGGVLLLIGGVVSFSAATRNLTTDDK